MADYNWDMKSDVGGYLGQENKPVSTDSASRDEEGNDDQRRRYRSLQAASEWSGEANDAESCGEDEGAGAQDRPSYVKSQFGLEGITGSNRTKGSQPHLGGTDTSSKRAGDSRGSASDRTTPPDGDGWRPEDLTRIKGSKKHEVMNHIKEKLPGFHNAAEGEWMDPKAVPKKGVAEKIKEKLSIHHGNDAGT